MATTTQATAVRVPITNIYGGGDYTAQIAVGSQRVPANVILDTGSSTLAVNPSVYDPTADTSKQETALAQDVLYGTGGWTGPVLKTELALGPHSDPVTIEAYVALTDDQQPGNFGSADGILGLAYNVLNDAYNVAGYLSEQGVSPALTYPWPFPSRTSSVVVQQFAALFERLPKEDLPPYFTALEAQGIAKNVFAFYTLRSTPSQRLKDPATDPVNQGFFILGGGEEQHDLYEGGFVNVQVVDDAWYNTNLRAVQVGSRPAVAVKALPPRSAKTMLSNSIVDSGTNSLVLAAGVYETILASLEAIDPSLVQLVEAAQRGAIATSDLQIEKWPAITFTLAGENGEDVPLTVSPSTYWQLDAPRAGYAMFQINSWAQDQSILGLPLLNNYYTVFDRSADPYGVIRFAPIAAAGSVVG